MLTGIYGEPLELVRGWLQGLNAFASFAPDLAVHAYQRIGTATAPVAGDAWAVVRYPTDGHSIILQPGLDVSRQIEVTLVRVVTAVSASAVEAIVSDIGDIVGELMAAAEAAGILTQIKLKDYAIDESTDPPTIGGVFHLVLDLGGR
jgi:hypothetical protein